VTAAASAHQEPAEDEKERLNRKLIELLNELRVALPGVQVLFAFLLILPFTEGFARVTTLQRYVFAATFVSTAITATLFIAPAAFHRLRYRQLETELLDEKRETLVTQHRLLIAGLLALAVSMSGVTLLIFDVLFGTPQAILLSVALMGTFLWFWYGLALSRRDPIVETNTPRKG
jgi:hypothetical protein